jgi:hypothetical protein
VITKRVEARRRRQSSAGVAVASMKKESAMAIKQVQIKRATRSQPTGTTLLSLKSALELKLKELPAANEDGESRW